MFSTKNNTWKSNFYIICWCNRESGAIVKLHLFKTLNKNIDAHTYIYQVLKNGIGTYMYVSGQCWVHKKDKKYSAVFMPEKWA